MTAYEFTRFENDRTHLLKATGYDPRVIAQQIDYNNPGKNYFRDTAEYRDARNTFIELTMSCNLDECIMWMGRFMLNAIAYGYTKDLNWRAYFMAAYDIREELFKDKERQTEQMLRFNQYC